jgi:predicted transcriptional regulator
MIEPTRKAPMTIATVLPKRAVTLLDRVRSSTDQIRGAEDDIKAAAAQRRKDVIALRSMRVTYREIAEAMGVTEQVVYKILRPEIAAARAEVEEDE